MGEVMAGGTGEILEILGQVVTLLLLAWMWIRHGLPGILADVSPLLGSPAAPAPAQVADDVAGTGAAVHTALLLTGAALTRAAPRALGSPSSQLYTAAAAFAAYALYGGVLRGACCDWAADTGVGWAASWSEAGWFLVGALVQLSDDQTIGVLPATAAGYLPAMVGTYLGALAFFEWFLMPVWNMWFRHAIRGVLGLDGSFPPVDDPDFLATHGLYLSTTHVLSVCAGVAGCYAARQFLNRIDAWLDPVPTGVTNQREEKNLLIWLTIGGLTYLWCSWIDQLAALQVELHTPRMVALRKAFFGSYAADDLTVRRAAMLSYGMWFLAGGLFELTWPVSASNRPQRRPAAWRLRREDAGGTAARPPSVRSAAAQRVPHADKCYPPAPHNRGWTDRVLPPLGMGILVAATRGSPPPAALAVFIVLIYAYRTTFHPEHIPSVDTFSNTSAKFKAIRKANYPPPYPNSWYRVCNSVDLEGGKIRSISVLGREFVAFRGEDGIAGVLNAFCPHLGSHLGAGCVKGNSIQCPYHNWEFNAQGQCTHIPYSRFNPPRGEAMLARTRQKAYEVREHLGMVFIWFDAEGRPPQWEMRYHLDVMDSDRFYFANMAQLHFDMHLSEAHENSADWYHFQTLHRPFPVPGLSRLIAGRHCIQRKYWEGELTGKGKGRGPDRDIPGVPFAGEEKHIVTFDEEMEELYFLGWRIPYFSGRTGGAHVIFEGPAMMQFTVDLPMGLGRTRMLKTFTPVSEFETLVEVRWFAEKTVCPHVVKFMQMIARDALIQDKEVWDRKLYRHVQAPEGLRSMTLADNDGPFRQFREWYGQFFSEHSADMDDPAKLTW